MVERGMFNQACRGRHLRFINQLWLFIVIDNLPPITAEHTLQVRSMWNLLRL